MTDDTALVRACADIMGWTYKHGSFWGNNAPVTWNPLTDEHASAQLVERMVELGWYADVYCDNRNRWTAEFQLAEDPTIYSIVEIAPLTPESRKRAIAEAAVKCFEKGE
jgi:hypothetical protein